MAAGKYEIAEDSEVQRASVDGIKLGKGREPQSLTKDQQDRLEAVGVKLTSASTPNQGGDS